MPTYIVKGYRKSSDKEKQTMYVGQSAKDAFSYIDTYSIHSEIEIEIWEHGQLVITHKQKDLRPW